MGILLKHTFKNIFKKPFRSLMVVFCIMVCSLTALFAFDMSSALKNLFTGLYSSFFGHADIVITGENLEDELFEEECFENARLLSLCVGGSSFYKRVDGEYTYMTEDRLGLFGMDLETAKDMAVVVYDITLAEDELILSADFAEKYGYSEGDDIILYNRDEEEYTYKVIKIHDYNGKGLMATNSAVISLEGVERMSNGRTPSMDILEIEFLNKKDVKTATEYLKDKYSYLEIESLSDNEDIDEQVGSIQNLFLLLFAICLLMVLFVTISVSERIVSERMAVVGTLRSLGLSSSMTTFTLLLENITYGITGGGIGCIIYSLIRDVILGSMIGTDGMDSMGISVDIQFGHVSVFLYIAIILGAVIIECLCPVKEIIKAVKTSIRDIIFANKDTEFKINRTSNVIGIILLIVAVVTGVINILIKENFVLSLISLVSCVFSLALLFHYPLRFIAGLFEKAFDKWNMPVARMSATMVRTKKSTVGSNVLIATAAALAIVIFAVSTSLLNMLTLEVYGSDIIVTTNGLKSESYFSYIQHLEDVEEVSYAYLNIEDLEINGDTTKFTTVYGLSDVALNEFSCLSECTQTLGDEDVIMDQKFAKKHGINVGDKVTVVFNKEGYVPIEKELNVLEFENLYAIDSSRNILIISDKLCKFIYPSISPELIFVNCKASEKVEEVKGLINKYSKKDIIYVKTRQEAFDDMIAQGQGIIGVLNFVIYFGVALTFIGSVSNLLIGFEGRKREFAVLLSTAMSRQKLKKMLYLESLISSAVSLIIAFPIGLYLLKPVGDAMNAIDAGVEILIQPGMYLGFVIVLFVVFTLTAVFPVKQLKKMKIAEQLKYE